jgi:anti-sigma factor ChrR (cupin superfamily)
MITEQQQDQATRYALGELSSAETQEFVTQLRVNPELRDFLYSLEKTVNGLAMSAPPVAPPAALKDKVLARLRTQAATSSLPVPDTTALLSPGLHFLARDESGWKPLPIPGAFIKLLSLQTDRGYAVLLGKLNAGVRYPAHTNAGPEDFYLLTGDLHISGRALGAGDFHHADAGSFHEENYSVEGCTLLAVLTTDDPLVQFALR